MSATQAFRPVGEAPPRPGGEVVWAHAPGADKLRALLHLAYRLRAARNGITMLLTAPPDADLPRVRRQGVICAAIPSEQPEEIEAFLSHFRPDFCLWTQGNLRPVLIARTARRGVPIYLVDAEERGFDDMRRRWFPDSARNVLQHLSGVFAASANSAQRIRRLGVPEARITVTGRLQEGGCVLPVSLTEREELSKALAGRSLWLAAGVQPDEMELILAAHHAASRLAHRLLLVIVPARDEDAQTFETRLQDEGWRVALWSHGDRPNENTQILLADSAEDMGLWYRVAPITLMAGSLLPGCTGQDPYEAAALGSAILFGPFVADHRDPYRRLSDAGGARLVRGADALGKALIRLIAPDQAASMALAGWEVASSGAEVTDRVSDLIQDALDQGQAR